VTAEQRIRESLAVQEKLLEPEMLAAIDRAAELIANTLRRGNKLLLFGNGGSAADATHIAAEFVGRFLRERAALPALSLSDNASAVTAIGNDYGFDRVFARQVEAQGVAGDCALAISTSGTSANIVAGLQAAQERGLATIGLTGGSGGEMPPLCDVCLIAPSDETPRIQEAHTLIAHLLCELAETALS
jgi:D-sedoheptulose 7-phosphate isomerase